MLRRARGVNVGQPCVPGVPTTCRLASYSARARRTSLAHLLFQAIQFAACLRHVQFARRILPWLRLNRATLPNAANDQLLAFWPPIAELFWISTACRAGTRRSLFRLRKLDVGPGSVHAQAKGGQIGRNHRPWQSARRLAEGRGAFGWRARQLLGRFEWNGQ